MKAWNSTLNVGKGLKPSKPIAKVSSKPKPKKKKPAAKTLLALADKLAGAHCRAKGYCEAAGWEKRHSKACGGCLEWCHIKSRSHKSIRHAPWNSCCLCTACHFYFTTHNDEWVRFIDDLFPGRWDVLNEALQKKEKPNYMAWISFYRAEQSEQALQEAV